MSLHIDRYIDIYISIYRYIDRYIYIYNCKKNPSAVNKKEKAQ